MKIISKREEKPFNSHQDNILLNKILMNLKIIISNSIIKINLSEDMGITVMGKSTMMKMGTFSLLEMPTTLNDDLIDNHNFLSAMILIITWLLVMIIIISKLIFIFIKSNFICLVSLSVWIGELSETLTRN